MNSKSQTMQTSPNALVPSIFNFTAPQSSSHSQSAAATSHQQGKRDETLLPKHSSIIIKQFEIHDISERTVDELRSEPLQN